MKEFFGKAMKWAVTIFAVFGLLVFCGLFASDSSSPQKNISRNGNSETWKQYASIYSNQDVLSQLANTQKLIIALQSDVATVSSDISSVAIQNASLKAALDTVENQLKTAQKQAEEESKRQRIEQWITTIVGTLGGWLLGLFLPTNDIFEKIGLQINTLFPHSENE